MAKLTALQANELAGDFLGLAQAIGDFRFENWGTLSKTENKRLGNLQWSILNYGEDILAFSTTLVMNDIEDNLTQIKLLTQKIKGTITRLKKVQKAIDTATAIVSLGGAILSKDPLSIAAGIQDLADFWMG